MRRSAPKHNFGSGAVKLPHSGVERKYIDPVPVDASKNKAKQAETKETRVVKSKKRETSEEKTVSPSHETNLNVLIIVAGGLAWFLFR